MTNHEGFVSLVHFKGGDAETSDVWKPGDTIEGQYLGYAEREMNEKIVRRYMILTESGIVEFIGTSQLDILKHLPQNLTIRIIYNGEGPKGGKGGNRVKLFDVLVPRYEMNNNLGHAVAASLMEQRQMPALVVGDADPFHDQEDDQV